MAMELLKRKKKIIGYTSGVYDLFHVGHLNILENAKSLCDKLIVGVTTDELVKEYKGKNTVIPFSERIRIVRSIKHVDGVVGNSSSGLLEAPSFKIGTINIGDRQRGRIMADSVVDCGPTRKSIGDALKRLYSTDFQKTLKTVVNPYGTGGASEAIVKKLEDISLSDILKKGFYDLEFE